MSLFPSSLYSNGYSYTCIYIYPMADEAVYFIYDGRA